jgi:hypothetical protein
VTARLLVGAFLLLASISQNSSKTFDVSSESSLYDVRGRVNGAFHIEPSLVRVVVRGGSILSTRAELRVEVRAILAGPSGSSWRKIASSEPRSLGAFEASERRTLTDSLVFSIPIQSGFDPQQHWLAFEFGRSDGSSTYACSDRNLAGPDSLSARRAQQMRTFYPMAC